MSGFIEGENRYQSTLFPEQVDDFVDEDSVVRVIDVFVDRLDISGLGFKAEAAGTGRPGYHPRTMLKIYVYGYLNRVHSSRRLEREAKRNVELMWLTSRLAPDFKTIADFRKDNGEAIRLVCREFVMLRRFQPPAMNFSVSPLEKSAAQTSRPRVSNVPESDPRSMEVRDDLRRNQPS
jgi:transposase